MAQLVPAGPLVVVDEEEVVLGEGGVKGQCLSWLLPPLRPGQRDLQGDRPPEDRLPKDRPPRDAC